MNAQCWKYPRLSAVQRHRDGLFSSCDVVEIAFMNLLSYLYMYVVPRQWFDIIGRGQSNDILEPLGFLFALKETMRLTPGALLFGGIPCCRCFSCNAPCKFRTWTDTCFDWDFLMAVLWLFLPMTLHSWILIINCCFRIFWDSGVLCMNVVFKYLHRKQNRNRTKLGVDLMLHPPTAPLYSWRRAPLSWSYETNQVGHLI